MSKTKQEKIAIVSLYSINIILLVLKSIFDLYAGFSKEEFSISMFFLGNTYYIVSLCIFLAFMCFLFLLVIVSNLKIDKYKSLLIIALLISAVFQIIAIRSFINLEYYIFPFEDMLYCFFFSIVGIILKKNKITELGIIFIAYGFLRSLFLFPKMIGSVDESGEDILLVATGIEIWTLLFFQLIMIFIFVVTARKNLKSLKENIVEDNWIIKQVTSELKNETQLI
ncbi:MAG: hypothetical protein HGN29_05600 [Asgard group archaeon]|nr:hypothetical protein [Asgard group archaeon]